MPKIGMSDRYNFDHKKNGPGAKNILKGPILAKDLSDNCGPSQPILGPSELNQ